MYSSEVVKITKREERDRYKVKKKLITVKETLLDKIGER